MKIFVEEKFIPNRFNGDHYDQKYKNQYIVDRLMSIHHIR